VSYLLFLLAFRLAGAKVTNSFLSGKRFEKFFEKYLFSFSSQFSYQLFKERCSFSGVQM
jgi:hypothetical protein